MEPDGKSSLWAKSYKILQALQGEKTKTTQKKGATFENSQRPLESDEELNEFGLILALNC